MRLSSNVLMSDTVICVKMNYLNKASFLLIVVLGLISTGFSLKCYKYSCGPKCDVNQEALLIHKHEIVQCTPGEICVASRHYANVGYIDRGCSSDTKYCDTHHRTFYMCHTCKEDLCNDL